MTTMGFRYHSGPSRVVEALEKATSTFVVGDLVYLNEGLVTVLASDQTIYGVALKAGSGTTGTGTATIPIQVITPNTYFICEVDTTSATTDVGSKFGLNITGGSQSIDMADTTTTSVRIEGLAEAAAATGRVIVRFEDSVLGGDT